MASLAEGEAVALSTRIYSGRLAVHLLPRCWGYWPASLCLCDVARGWGVCLPASLSFLPHDATPAAGRVAGRGATNRTIFATCLSNHYLVPSI